MPLSEVMLFACMLSVSVRMTGTPPTQLASKYSPAPLFFAAISSSCQLFANISLFAVTTLLPCCNALIRKLFAGSTPPKNSATIWISSSFTMSSIFCVTMLSSTPSSLHLARFLSSTRLTSMSSPSFAFIISRLSRSISYVPPPTTPSPKSATPIFFICLPAQNL